MEQPYKMNAFLILRDSGTQYQLEEIEAKDRSSHFQIWIYTSHITIVNPNYKGPKIRTLLLMALGHKPKFVKPLNQTCSEHNPKPITYIPKSVPRLQK